MLLRITTARVRKSRDKCPLKATEQEHRESTHHKMSLCGNAAAAIPLTLLLARLGIGCAACNSAPGAGFMTRLFSREFAMPSLATLALQGLTK